MNVARELDLIEQANARFAEPPAETEQQAIERLARLPGLEYDRIREEEAKALGVRVSALDKEVSAARKGIEGDTAAKPSMFNDPEPYPLPVDGAELLGEVYHTMRRFIVCEPETAVATTLWIAMTWMMDVVKVAPLAVITAPEKRCGKTQLLAFIGMLAHRPLVAANISPSAVFRVIEAFKPTLLMDEADAWMRDNEELRGVINSGHTRQSAYVIRNVGDDHEPRQFSTWGAKAISGIGHQADTIMDRAVKLELRRKLPHEHAERLRHADDEHFDTLRAKLARFALDAAPIIAKARPHLPDALNDRAQDNAEPLLSIADHAGGDWPRRARDALLRIYGAEQEAVSMSAELLADIRDVFEEKRLSKISTAELLEALCSDDERPWSTYNRGRPMSARQLAKRLSEYGIASKTIRISYNTAKGYELDQFKDAFARYLSPCAIPPSTSVTPSQPHADGASDVTDKGAVTVTQTLSETRKPASGQACDVVTDFSGGAGEDMEAF